ncbi:MAG: PHP domain-containing protein [Verrucomicrobiota bacterium]|nr:PHP domain-containing protein [Verrucomicrobiota bacterium]
MLDNAAIAELFIEEAAKAEGHRERAFRRAARAAFMWPEEASEIAAAGRPLTELVGIGPSLNKRLQAWLESPPAEIAEIPAIRREFMTRAQARKILAKNPQWQGKLRGDLQMHSEWSDGATAIAEMAAAGIERGYEYIAITDHTKGLKIAGGLDEERLAEQAKEIARLNKDFRDGGAHFTILHAAEMNLSPDGGGDMEPVALAKLDLVLGCFHSALRRTEDQTERYLAGVRNPHIQILGHPQTRIYDRREGLHADWSRVFAEAARLDKAVEIDGDPNRQDLRVSLLKIARKEGCRISLGTDAHHPDEFAYMELALAAACVAKIPAERIVSFLPLGKLQQWVANVRAASV